MGTLESFEHTADVGLRVTGDDLDDLFRTAAEGVFDFVVVNRAQVRATRRETLELEADTTAELLVAWLNELVFRSETGHTLFGTFEVHVAADGLSLRAEALGEPIDVERHQLDHEVKAVTRHGLDVRRGDDGRWIVELILDV